MLMDRLQNPKKKKKKKKKKIMTSSRQGVEEIDFSSHGTAVYMAPSQIFIPSAHQRARDRRHRVYNAAGGSRQATMARIPRTAEMVIKPSFYSASKR